MATDRELAAQSMMQAGIGSLGARSTLPRFTNREEAIARGHGGHPDQLYDQKINRIISEGHQKQDRWEELGGPNYLFEPSPGKTFNFPQYPILNKGKIGPGWTEAGIPATNQGYKVMNASDPTGNYGWIDRLRRWLFNDPYDKESDESLYEDEFPTYDPNNPNHFMMPPEGLPEDFPLEDIFNAPTMEANVPKWYKWYDKLIKRFGQEKGSQLWHQYASHGGIMGLV